MQVQYSEKNIRDAFDEIFWIIDQHPAGLLKNSEFINGMTILDSYGPENCATFVSSWEVWAMLKKLDKQRMKGPKRPKEMFELFCQTHRAGMYKHLQNIGHTDVTPYLVSAELENFWESSEDADCYAQEMDEFEEAWEKWLEAGNEDPSAQQDSDVVRFLKEVLLMKERPFSKAEWGIRCPQGAPELCLHCQISSDLDEEGVVEGDILLQAGICSRFIHSTYLKEYKQLLTKLYSEED
jgi:hypothetical protein